MLICNCYVLRTAKTLNNCKTCDECRIFTTRLGQKKLNLFVVIIWQMKVGKHFSHMKIHARYLESPSLLLRLDVCITFPLLNTNMNAILCLSNASMASCQEMNLNSLMIVGLI
jgi:hypothetical protein